MSFEVLLADDDDSIRLVLSKALSKDGHTVRATDNADTLLKWVEAGRGDVIVTDVLMNGAEVFSTLPSIHSARPDLPIIVISANNTVLTALKSGKHRVFEYLPKPFDLSDIQTAVSRAGQSVQTRRSKRTKNDALPMVGTSASMQPVYRAVSRYADADLPVLISGEVGTGKDLIATLLHSGGARRERPFFRTHDFSNLSLTLQKADGGDIFVDEIAGLAADQQTALLEVLTESERIPAARRPRIISSTRKDLRELAKKGEFRDDLYFRIAVAEIRVPALSERRDDIPALAEHFLGQVGQSSRRFEADALDVLQRHDWTGNVRELENLVRRLSVLYSDEVISAVMVLNELDKDLSAPSEQGDSLAAILKVACRRLLREGTDDGSTHHQTALAWVERPLIQEALRASGGNRARAATLLGIHRNTLRTRISGLELE